MNQSSLDQFADSVLAAYADLEGAIHSSEAFPRREFDTFFNSVVRYVEATKDTGFVHRTVASQLNGFSQFLQTLHKNLSDDVLYQADRLETIFFSAYDPYFKGGEPLGL